MGIGREENGRLDKDKKGIRRDGNWVGGGREWAVGKGAGLVVPVEIALPIHPCGDSIQNLH